VTTLNDRLKSATKENPDLSIFYYRITPSPAGYDANVARERRNRAVAHHLNRRKQDAPYKLKKYNAKIGFRAGGSERKARRDDIQPRPRKAKASKKPKKAVGANLDPQATPTPSVPSVEAHQSIPPVKKYFKGGFLVRPSPTERRLKLRTFPAHKIPPITCTYPKLDSFLIDDFKPVLGMLLEATPKTTTKAEGAQLDIDSEYWEGCDSDVDESMGSIGELIDDITYAPLSEARRVRPVSTVRTYWFGSRGVESSLALETRPENFTQESFLVYLRRLIAIGVRSGRDGEAEQMNFATREIISLLNDERFLPNLTNRGLHVAMDYLSWQNEFKTMVKVYHRLRNISFSFDGLGFSRFLFAAALERTGLHFRPILEHMLSSGFHPTGHTWYTFYQLINRKYPDKRRQVLLAMRNKGLLDDGCTVKEALVNSLGWIEKPELVPDPPVRTYHTTKLTRASRASEESELVPDPPVEAYNPTKVNTPFSMSELLSRP
jgi:hypothetical protein